MDGLYLKEVHKFEINEKGEVISHFSQTQILNLLMKLILKFQLKKSSTIIN